MLLELLLSRKRKAQLQKSLLVMNQPPGCSFHIVAREKVFKNLPLEGGMDELFKRAIDPLQYDSEDVFWENETGIESPTRSFFYEYLTQYRYLWKDAEILDVGCGTCWLLDLFNRNGASFVEGIEPSLRNVEIARRIFPEILVFHGDLNSFVSQRPYDLVTAVMVFNHISDISDAFNKIYSFLKPRGELQIIIPDYDYFKRLRYGYEMAIEGLNNDEYVVQTRREQGILADVVRKVSVYERIAENEGLLFLEDVAMYPTEMLIKKAPRYSEYRNTSLSHLLRFKKS